MLVNYRNPEAPHGTPPVKVYDNGGALFLTITDEFIDALIAFRRKVAGEVAYWAANRDLGRFAKDEQKRATREEKAATIWLRHFTEVGKKQPIRTFPAEMSDELDAALRHGLTALDS